MGCSHFESVGKSNSRLAIKKTRRNQVEMSNIAGINDSMDCRKGRCYTSDTRSECIRLKAPPAGLNST